jgi:hypothetical protein
MTMHRRAAAVSSSLALLALCGYAAPLAHAEYSDAAIARTYVVSGAEPASGDLISFDRENDTLRLSSVASDQSLFGVVVTDPVLVLRAPGATVPIVTTGQVAVNVTTAGGAIKAGDFITTSSVPGKGQLASSTTAFIVGTALAPFPASSTPAASAAPQSGSIPVLLSIGPRPDAPGQTSSGTAAGSATGKYAVGASTLLRYFLAAVVAIGSIAIAFRNFGSSIRDGIISVGRNPLAKSSIQSMVILNAFLIALVSAGGLFIGFAILFLPI